MILDAFKFTNDLFSNHFSKFLVIVFPVYVIIFIVYSLISSIPGNEFGTTNVSFTSYVQELLTCLLYTSPSPRDVEESRMPSSA